MPMSELLLKMMEVIERLFVVHSSGFLVVVVHNSVGRENTYEWRRNWYSFEKLNEMNFPLF